MSCNDGSGGGFKPPSTLSQPAAQLTSDHAAIARSRLSQIASHLNPESSSAEAEFEAFQTASAPLDESVLMSGGIQSSDEVETSTTQVSTDWIDEFNTQESSMPAATEISHAVERASTEQPISTTPQANAPIDRGFFMAGAQIQAYEGQARQTVDTITQQLNATSLNPSLREEIAATATMDGTPGRTTLSPLLASPAIHACHSSEDSIPEWEYLRSLLKAEAITTHEQAIDLADAVGNIRSTIGDFFLTLTADESGHFDKLWGQGARFKHELSAQQSSAPKGDHEASTNEPRAQLDDTSLMSGAIISPDEIHTTQSSTLADLIKERKDFQEKSGDIVLQPFNTQHSAAKSPAAEAQMTSPPSSAQKLRNFLQVPEITSFDQCAELSEAIIASDPKPNSEAFTRAYTADEIAHLKKLYGQACTYVKRNNMLFSYLKTVTSIKTLAQAQEFANKVAIWPEYSRGEMRDVIRSWKPRELQMAHVHARDVEWELEGVEEGEKTETQTSILVPVVDEKVLSASEKAKLDLLNTPTIRSLEEVMIFGARINTLHHTIMGAASDGSGMRVGILFSRSNNLTFLNRLGGAIDILAADKKKMETEIEAIDAVADIALAAERHDTVTHRRRQIYELEEFVIGALKDEKAAAEAAARRGLKMLMEVVLDELAIHGITLSN